MVHKTGAHHNDEENAYIKYAEMLAIYANEKTLPKEVFQIGDIYIEVDNTEKARALYQQVLDEWPEVVTSYYSI